MFKCEAVNREYMLFSGDLLIFEIINHPLASWIKEIKTEI